MLTYFTAPRLATLQAFFKTKSDKDLLGCYAWNQAVAAGLFPLLGDFEVAFRNALHLALSRYYGGHDSVNWMLPRPNPALATNPAAPPTLPSLHSMTSKTRQELVALEAKIKTKKGTHYKVTPDDIVAGLHFGFWEVLIKGLDNSAHPPGLQGAILSAVFPYAPNLVAVPHGHVAFKLRVTRLLLRLRDVRNRIGHHDSLWTTPEFNEHGLVGFIPRRPRQTVLSLQKYCDSLCWLAGWINPAISKHILESDHWWTLQALLSRQALVAYRTQGGRIGTYQSVLGSTPFPREAKVDHRQKAYGILAERVNSRTYHY